MSQPLNLDPIKALCAAATPGPWCLASRGEEQSHDSVWPADLNAEQRTALVENTDRHSGDARFIAESRAIVPALVAEIERLRAEAAEAEQARSLIERAVRWVDEPCDLLNLSSIVETIADRYAEVGGDALWGRLSQEPNAPVDLQFLRDATYAVWTGEPMAEETNDALTEAFIEIERLRAEVANGPAAKVRHDHPHVKLTDADLVRLAVQSAGRRGEIVLRYAAVTEVFQCNGDVAVVLCGACGLDPHDHVGDDGEGEE